LLPGQPVDTYYLREWAGVNPDNGAPMWYKTVDGAGNAIEKTTTSKYGEANQVSTGKLSADVYGGITTAVRYKKIDFNAVFGYSIGAKLYNYARQEYDADGTYTDRNQMKLKSGWSRWE